MQTEESLQLQQAYSKRPTIVALEIHSQNDMPISQQNSIASVRSDFQFQLQQRKEEKSIDKDQIRRHRKAKNFISTVSNAISYFNTYYDAEQARQSRKQIEDQAEKKQKEIEGLKKKLKDLQIQAKLLGKLKEKTENDYQITKNLALKDRHQKQELDSLVHKMKQQLREKDLQLQQINTSLAIQKQTTQNMTKTVKNIINKDKSQSEKNADIGRNYINQEEKEHLEKALANTIYEQEQVIANISKMEQLLQAKLIEIESYSNKLKVEKEARVKIEKDKRMFNSEVSQLKPTSAFPYVPITESNLEQFTQEQEMKDKQKRTRPKTAMARKK